MASPIDVTNLITDEANSQGVPASLALAVAQQESGFNQSAVGRAGEVGVFQLLPSSFPGQDIGDVYTNVNLGVGYLAQLYDQFGSWATALAAYNFGPTNVANGKPIPSSTQSYVQNILSNSGVDSSGDSIDAGSIVDYTDAGSPAAAVSPSR